MKDYLDKEFAEAADRDRRDKFVCAALQGIYSGNHGVEVNRDSIRVAIQIADATIKMMGE